MEHARPKKEGMPELTQIYVITYMDVGNQTFSGQHKTGYPTTHTYGTTTSLADPTKNRYIFGGWFLKSNALGTALTSLSATGYTEGITLYARWNIVSQTGHHLMQIPAGTFLMGSPANEPGRDTDEIQHQVTLTAGFYMGKYQVTQAQYQTVMESNPSYYSSNGNGASRVSGLNTVNFPAEMVTWYDAIEFCNKLSVLEGLTPVYTITGRTPASGYPITNATVTPNLSATGYRLPTEAQWEYACRAGTTTAYNWGTNTIDPTWAKNNFDQDRTTEVGRYDPNAWGLYDMHGNVWEWCWDRGGDYPEEAQTDPTGPVSGSSRVMRGGSIGIEGEYMRSARREANTPQTRNSSTGFRVVRP
jgi:uncharacterized repeat protein (TIGR02543 family)